MWIKPFLILVCTACWLFTALCVFRRTQRPWPRLAADGFGLLAGGLIVGGLGFLWLRDTGAWPYFLQVFLEWDPEYYAAVQMTLAFQLRFLLSQLFPWGLVHLVAAPTAFWTVYRTTDHDELHTGDSLRFSRGLLSMLYLAWLGQVLFFQKPFDYVLARCRFLALAVLWSQNWAVSRRVRAGGFAALSAFCLTAALHHPLLDLHRLSLWPQCWQQGSSAELRDRLALIDARNTTDWQDLDRVRDFLTGLELRDGELTCYNNSTLSLYFDLNFVALDPLSVVRHVVELFSQSPRRDSPRSGRQPATLRGERSAVGRSIAWSGSGSIARPVADFAAGISWQLVAAFSLEPARRISLRSLRSAASRAPDRRTVSGRVSGKMLIAATLSMLVNAMRCIECSRQRC